jgi:hypothetical protein
VVEKCLSVGAVGHDVLKFDLGVPGARSQNGEEHCRDAVDRRPTGFEQVDLVGFLYPDGELIAAGRSLEEPWAEKLASSKESVGDFRV